MTNPIRLGDFILQNMEPILEQWEEFATTINPPALTMSSESLRDHAELMLQTIALDLSTSQTEKEQADKSKDMAPESPEGTAAEDHAEARLSHGFTIGQLFSEYRALRASVLHLWDQNSKQGLITDPVDITRFNEAIDQAIAESVARYSTLLKTSQDTFLAILGHDLRNPLSTTIMCSSILMRHEDVNDKVISVAARIYNSSQRMNKLISDLIDFTRSQLGKRLPVVLAPTNLAMICADIIEEQRISNPEHIILWEMNGSFDGNWDKDRIAQVFSNLLGNAIQHGTISSPIEINLTSSQNSVVITITNKGKAIPPSKIKHIFEPLVRFEENENVDYSQKTSLGLGLYIAREIVLAHDGTVSVTSSEANGTTFEIVLPRYL
ncbi:MAG: HAMP domain-containing histidine kinase [Methylotenera sp.]|nr:HAMP domain-containing histidine kinase [Methylotenera sp.]